MMKLIGCEESGDRLLVRLGFDLVSVSNALVQKAVGELPKF